MKSFDEFIAWSEANGVDDEIATASSELIAEGMKELEPLTKEQVKAMYLLTTLVSGATTMGFLDAYHRWINQQ